MKRDTRKKSNRLKLLSGNPGKRGIKPEPKFSKPDENPPDSLNAIGKAEWNRIAPELREAGVLTKMDETIFWAYCQELSVSVLCIKKIKKEGLMVKRTPRSKVLTPNPYLLIQQKSISLLKSLASELGLTPVSRGRVSVNPVPADDPYAKLKAEREARLADAQAKAKRKAGKNQDDNHPRPTG